MTLDEFNKLPAASAARELLRCCGSREWVQGMGNARPFESVAALNSEADQIWWRLAPADWLEAFHAHPRIGGPTSDSVWAAQEQAAVGSAANSTLTELAQANEEYQAKFGYLFIVCATGKSAEEMLAILRSRLGNDPEDELQIAATEQSKIARIRLEKLVTV
ncbi:MAG: 2-oxo-4-hydroxy-4-carboxy-5-ureidoimidazoline decarboxylase [Acidobacteriota bacterium]|nr:2-oxo-4-hydroxy-4-carboxy-5-ureidoimidazoline decarboxylase [Acidobacteriota bacterium]